MRTLLIAIVLVVLAVLARMAFILVPASGALADLEETGLQGCEAVTIAPGTEDVTIHPGTGFAYVSAAQRRGGDESGNGIWTFDPGARDRQPEKVDDGPADFAPHGISLLVREGAPDRLFVINHSRASGERIEIFEIGPEGRLAHVDSITYPELTSPNDLVAVGPRRFYATNDRRYQAGFMSQLEAFLGLPLSSVSYFNGEDGQIAADGLQFANGIALGADGRTIYVAEFLGRRVNAYRPGPDGRLNRVDRYPVHTGADNIEIGPQGELWIGAHPDVFAFLDHAGDPGEIAPSEVIRLDPQAGTVTRELVSLQGEINASSVAAVSADRLVVGAVFDDHVLVCPR